MLLYARPKINTKTKQKNATNVKHISPVIIISASLLFQNLSVGQLIDSSKLMSLFLFDYLCSTFYEYVFFFMIKPQSTQYCINYSFSVAI